MKKLFFVVVLMITSTTMLFSQTKFWKITKVDGTCTYVKFSDILNEEIVDSVGYNPIVDSLYDCLQSGKWYLSYVGTRPVGSSSDFSVLSVDSSYYSNYDIYSKEVIRTYNSNNFLLLEEIYTLVVGVEIFQKNPTMKFTFCELTKERLAYTYVVGSTEYKGIQTHTKK